MSTKRKNKKITLSKSSPTLNNKLPRKYTVDNEQFFPTLVSVKKGHEELVRQQKIIEKTNKLREFAWQYYRLKFSEDATLEKMLRNLKLSGVTVPEELGGPPKKIGKSNDDDSTDDGRKQKSQAPSPGGFDGLFFDRTKHKGPFFEQDEDDEDAHLRNPDNGIYTCDGIHFFPRLILMERWLKKKKRTKLHLDSESKEARRTPAYDRLQRGKSSQNLRVKKNKNNNKRSENQKDSNIPLWWTGFGEQETRPNSKSSTYSRVGTASRERVTFTPPVPLTPDTKARRKKQLEEIKNQRQEQQTFSSREGSPSRLLRSRQGSREGSPSRFLRSRQGSRQRSRQRSRGGSPSRKLRSRQRNRDQLRSRPRPSRSRGRTPSTPSDMIIRPFSREGSSSRSSSRNLRSRSSTYSRGDSRRSRKHSRYRGTPPPRTPILRQIESATVGDYDLWAGKHDEVEEAHQGKLRLYTKFGDFSLLKIVSLSACGLDHKDANAIAHILTLRQTGILQMDLSYNMLTGPGADQYVGFERFFAAIGDRHCRLRALNLRGNRIHCEGARAVAVALKQNCNLTELDISEGYLTRNMDTHNVDYTGIIAISKSLFFNSHMWHLTMDTTFCNDEAGLELGEALTTTKTLKTFGKIQIQEALRNNVRKITIPMASGIPGAFVGLNLIKQCAKFTYPIPARLDTMRICNVHVTDPFIDLLCKSLRKNHGLQLLDLRHSTDLDGNDAIKINGKRMKKMSSAIDANKGLTALDISNHAIGDEGGKALADLIRKKMGYSCSDELVYQQKFVSITAKSNSIKSYGAEKLCQALHNNRVLTHLDISNNPIGDNEMFKTFFHEIRFKCSLISLNVSNCFYLTKNDDDEDDDDNDDEKTKLLKDNDSDTSDSSSESDVEEMIAPKRYKSWEKVFDEDSNQYYYANRETSESRWDRPTKDEGYWSSDDENDEVNNNKKKKKEKPFYHIKVRRQLLGDESNDEEDEEGDAAFLSDSEGEDEWGAKMAVHSNGKKIRALTKEEKETAALAIAELIFDNGETGNLTALDISCNNIGDQNMAFIVEALKSNGTLTSLSCGGNDMSPFGTLPFLAQTLGGRNALEHLSLRHEKLGDDGVFIFAKMITSCRINSLDLSETDMGTRGAKQIFSVLPSAKHLKRLNISGNPKVKLAGTMLGRYFPKILALDKLCYLNVTDCEIAEEVVQAVLYDELARLKGKTSLEVVGYGLEKLYKRRPSLSQINDQSLRCFMCEKYLSITKFTTVKLTQLDYDEIEDMIAKAFEGKLSCIMCDHKRAAKRRKALKPKKKYTIKMGSSAGGKVIKPLQILTKFYRPEDCGTYDV